MNQFYVIEFRDGSFFQNLESDHGGPKATAQRFESVQAVDRFMKSNEWILFYGGMAVRA